MAITSANLSQHRLNSILIETHLKCSSLSLNLLSSFLNLPILASRASHQRPPPRLAIADFPSTEASVQQSLMHLELMQPPNPRLPTSAKALFQPLIIMGMEYHHHIISSLDEGPCSLWPD